MNMHLRKNKGLLLSTVLFSIITSATAVGIALILQKVIDAALQGNMEAFQNIVFYSLFYLLLLGLLQYITAWCTKALIRDLTISLRESLFHGIFRKNYEDFSASNTSDYLSVLTNDIKQVEENYIYPLLFTLQNTVVFVASLSVLLYLSPLVTGILLVSTVLMFIVPSLFGKELQNKQIAVSSQMSVFTAQLKDLLSGFEIIKSYSMGLHSQKKFQQENQIAADRRFAADLLFALNESLSQILSISTQFCVVFVAAYLIISGKLSAGTLVALVQLSAGLVGPALVIMQNLPKIKSVKPILERIDALANYEDNSFTGELVPVFNESLQAHKLSFAYKEQPVLIDVDLTLQKGKKYALTGKSGSGKSTLVKLLTGNYARFDGSLTLDGVAFNQLDVEGLQQMVSTIHQNVYMFDTDIMQNICLYEDFPEEVLKSAINSSGMNKFLQEKPDGLASPVGENGNNLSGGQRQRIAVARALIRNKPILILDEGTSAIDMQTAYDIESKLLTLEDLTLVTITHNMSADLLSQYDQIIYMEDGRIAETGSLQELLERSSEFSRFYTLQK